MATAEDVKRLAALARIEVKEEDLPTFTKEFDAILAYVGQLEKLELPQDSLAVPALRNVFRPDEDSTAPGSWTEKMVQAFPEKEGDALKVKQIITHD